MAKLQYLDVAGLQRYDAAAVTRMANAITAAKTEANQYADSLAVNYDAAGTAQTKVNELANGQVKINKEAIETLNGGSGVAGSVDNKIAAAKTELEGKITDSQYNDTQVKADIAANTAAIAKLNGDVNTDGSVKKEVATQIAAIVNDNDSTSIDTLEEIAAWIGDHPDNAAAMNAKIVANANAIAALDTYVGDLPSGGATTVVGYVDQQVNALNTDLTAAIGTAKTEAINAAAADATEKANTAKSGAIEEAQAMDTALETSIKAYVAEEDNKVKERVSTLESAIGTTGDVTTAINNAQTAANTAQQTADSAVTAAGNAQAAADKAQGDVNALTLRVEALEALVGEGFEPIPYATIDALFNV